MSFNEFGFTRASVAYHPFTGRLIPTDTPVYMPFTEGEMGVLMVEGVTQELANAALMWDGAKLTGWSVGTGMSDAGYNIGEARVIAGTAGGGTARVRILQTLTVSEGDRVTVQCNIRKTGLVDGLHIGVEWIPSGDQDLVNITSMLTEEFQTFSHTAIAPAGTIAVRVYAPYAYAQTTNCEIEACMPMVQINGTEYWLPWHKEGTRAAPVKQITLPQALPATFAIGIAAKMLHAHDTATRTFWECGGYRCYFDANDEKIKLTNGTDTAELGAVWDADDYVGVYAGRENGNLFIQAKIAGALTDRVEAEAGAGGKGKEGGGG